MDGWKEGRKERERKKKERKKEGRKEKERKDYRQIYSMNLDAKIFKKTSANQIQKCI